jgi:hypothetical protein
LSDSKANVDFIRLLIDLAEKRLQNCGYSKGQTPFGYFLNMNINAPGFLLTRIPASL